MATLGSHDVTIAFNTMSGDEDISQKWDEFFTMLLDHPKWVQQYDTWTRRSKTYGTLSMSKPDTYLEGLDESLGKVMIKNGFRLEKPGNKPMYVTGYGARPPLEIL
ncbi:hypothetical protein V502_08479 [Pseudogymnoascus sp. VKM F-4520 (FW-2644)]|nr:hypothetical protein V502_08479 [Pseudogymnoascus sp. VKM F-4520 (FW-2644)]